MRYLIFLVIILFISCNDDDSTDPCMEMDCAFMDPIGLTVDPLKEAVLLHYGSYGHIDGPGKSCPPETFNIYMSENMVDYEKLASVEGNGTYLIENLEDGKELSFKVVGLHCELDSMVTYTRKIRVGEIPLPRFVESPLQFEDFRLAPDGDRFIYRTSSDSWLLSSLSNPAQGVRILDNSFNAQWNPNASDEISGVERIRVQIRENVNGIVSKTLISKDLNLGVPRVLHQIENHMDFNYGEFDPEKYWIHEFHYSVDGEKIFFVSNKDNGSNDSKGQRVYDNIWQLDLETNEIEQISDFLPIEFDMEDFVEDPKQPGNFYVIGGTVGDKVEIDGALFTMDKIDIYYFDSESNTLSSILVLEDEIKNISINPTGEKLVFAASITGRSELYSYDVSTEKLQQITHSKDYRPSYRWHYINWTSSDEFITFVRHEDRGKFAVFSL